MRQKASESIRASEDNDGFMRVPTPFLGWGRPRRVIHTQEVTGSIPVVPTTSIPLSIKACGFCIVPGMDPPSLFGPILAPDNKTPLTRR